MDAQPQQTDQSSAPPLIDADVPCAGCGYDLRTLRLDASCPECGKPVRDTMPSGDTFDVLTFSQESRQRHIKRWAINQAFNILAVLLILAFFLTNWTIKSHVGFLAIALILCGLAYLQARRELKGLQQCTVILGEDSIVFIDHEHHIWRRGDIKSVIIGLTSLRVVAPKKRIGIEWGSVEIPMAIPGFERLYDRLVAWNVRRHSTLSGWIRYIVQLLVRWMNLTLARLRSFLKRG